MRKILIILDKCVGCKACEVACAVEHSESKDEVEAIRERPRPISRISVKQGKTRNMDRRPRFGRSSKDISEKAAYPIRCRHCDDPKCVEACMSGALYKTESGAVIHDPQQCVGCWMCIMTCPYGAIVRDPENKIIVKCDLCLGRDVPACVEACKTGAIMAVEEEDLAQAIVEEVIQGAK